MCLVASVDTFHPHSLQDMGRRHHSLWESLRLAAFPGYIFSWNFAKSSLPSSLFQTRKVPNEKLFYEYFRRSDTLSSASCELCADDNLVVACPSIGTFTHWLGNRSHHPLRVSFDFKQYCWSRLGVKVALSHFMEYFIVYRMKNDCIDGPHGGFH